MAKLSSCKIKTDDMQVIYEDGTTDTIPAKYITYISIEKDFFNDLLPILNIKCLVTRDVYKKINSNVPKFKVSLKKFFINSDNSTFDKQSKNILYKKFINDVFINVNNADNTPDPTEDIANRTNSPVKDKQNEFEKNSIELNLLLFTERGLKYRKLNSKIFKNCNVMSAILALSQLTNQGSLLMTYPDNRKVYNNSDIIIPNNLTFKGGIKFLQSVYGIYEHGYLLFRDYDITYLIDKAMKCNAYRKGEFKRVYISFDDVTKSTGNIYGQYVDNANMRYMVNIINTPVVTTNSTADNEVLFDKLYVTNTYNGKTSTTNVNMQKSSAIKNTKVVEDKYNNPYAVKSSTYEISLNNYTIQVQFNEVDLDIMTPNKEYYLDIQMHKSEYKQISGLLKLSRLMAVYEKQDDETFAGMITADFKRA